MQVFYAIIAMTLIALLSITLQRGTHGAFRKKVVNEVATQLTGVGVDVLENIGRKWFDSQVDTTTIPIFPPVTDPAQLTPKGGFGGCTNYNAPGPACDDVDDYDGMSISRDVDGILYNVDIEVNYVDEANPDYQPGTNTYAKEVQLDISSPYLYFNDPSNPLTVRMTRIFTHQMTTKP